MALSKENSKDINDWLIEIDPGLFKYAQDFTRLDFTSSKTLKFFKPKDFDKFVCAPSSLHRRILLHNMEKLKTDSPTLFTYDTPPEKDAHYQVKDDQKGGRKELFPVPEERWNFKYKTPLESEIDDLKDEINLKTAELQSASEFCESIHARYASVNVDKSRSQCSLCHLRAGHTKRACPNGPCLSARQCCDVEKHPEEKRQLNEANERRRKITKELERLNAEVTAKEKVKEQVTNTFSGKITSHLVNSDPETYTFPNEGGTGRLLRSQKILNDSWILESHYHGKVPIDLATESKKWKDIINKHNEQYKKLSKSQIRENDPIKKRLEDNEKYPVVFPKYRKPSDEKNVGKDDNVPGTPSVGMQSYTMPPFQFPWWSFQSPGFSTFQSPQIPTTPFPHAPPSATLSYQDVYGTSTTAPPLPEGPPPSLPPEPDDNDACLPSNID